MGALGKKQKSKKNRASAKRVRSGNDRRAQVRREQQGKGGNERRAQGQREQQGKGGEEGRAKGRREQQGKSGEEGRVSSRTGLPQTSRIPAAEAFRDVKRLPPPDHLSGPGVANPHGEYAEKEPPRGKTKKKPVRASASNTRPTKAKKPPKPANPARRRRNRMIAAVLAIVLLIGAGLWFSTTMLFKIEKYVLEGTSPYTKEEIVTAFGHEIGENMLGFRAAGEEKRIVRMLPYIQQLDIRRRLPDTVVFKVTPAVAAYSMAWGDRYALLSTQLKVLEIATESPENLIVVNGLQEVAVEAGYPLRDLAQTQSETQGSGVSVSGEQSAGKPDPSAAGSSAAQLDDAEPGAPPSRTSSMQALVVLLKKLEESELSGVGWVDVSDPLNICFRWEDRVTVRLGSRSSMDEKIKFAKVLLADPEKKKIVENDRGVLDVSAYPDNMDRVFFTPE